MITIEKILQLSKSLYPRGRAFKIPEGSQLESLHIALGKSEVQAFNDASSVLYSILPDNSNFTVEDCRDWEHRLGMITNEAVSLSDRKSAIGRKISFPGVVKSRGHYLWLERQLRLAGFDVYVYENRFADYPSGYLTSPPEVVSVSTSFIDNFDYGEADYGEAEYGTIYFNLIANSITQIGDRFFNVGDNLKSTFFIGGPTIGSFANVDVNREKEFRQLILRTKPVQTIGFLFINYI